MHRLFQVLCLLLCLGFTTAFRSPVGTDADLSSPQSAFSSLLTALKTGNTDVLRSMSTQSGYTALESRDWKSGATELESAPVVWDEITSEIYLAHVRTAQQEHKLEFVKEDQSWLLYFWRSSGDTAPAGE